MPTSLQQGINAAKAGQTEKALEHLKNAIIEEPQNADVWVWLAAVIEEPQKQEIFLNKALEIDPQNIPAQRGLSYLQKRKQNDQGVKEGTLSDYTQPISPFPKTAGIAQTVQNTRDNQRKPDYLENLSAQDDSNPAPSSVDETPQEIPRMTALEIILLCVVVIVFAFIGLLASSALFDFDLPWEGLSNKRPTLATDPPYSGVFLYENEVFFDIQRHEGPPLTSDGIPTSSTAQPVIVFWQMQPDLTSINLIYESGSYVDYRSYHYGKSATLIQSPTELDNGLYCLQEIQPTSTSTDIFYCFQINQSLID
jgi:tetratricopeptide (TPR) repeat protein